MARPEVGFLWSHPGIPSLTVPYHDTNDFYYSGHVGACMMYLLEHLAVDFKPLYIYILCVLIFEWSLLMFLRTHYVIDLVTGALFAHFCHINAEWMSYILDVKLVGFQGEARQ